MATFHQNFLLLSLFFFCAFSGFPRVTFLLLGIYNEGFPWLFSTLIRLGERKRYSTANAAAVLPLSWRRRPFRSLAAYRVEASEERDALTGEKGLLLSASILFFSPRLRFFLPSPAVRHTHVDMKHVLLNFSQGPHSKMVSQLFFSRFFGHTTIVFFSLIK